MLASADLQIPGGQEAEAEKEKQRMAKAADKLNRNTKLSAERRQTTPVSVCGDIVSGVVGVYVFVMLTAFPLFATDMYFNILVDRYYFFWIATAAMTAISAAAALVCLFVDWKENQLQNFRALFFDDTEQACESASQKEAAGTKQAAQRNGKAGQTGKTAERNGAGRAVRLKLRSHLRAADCFLLAFLLVALLSTLCSDWLYEAFWGNMGRFQGFFLWIWYAAAYFMVTRFFRFHRIYLDIALAVGLYMAVWGIQDYLGLDPHGWLAEVEETQKSVFTSTIGNINTYTSVIGLYLSLSTVLFIGEGRGSLSKAVKKNNIIANIRNLYYLICIFIFFVALITGQSDNAVLGLFFLVLFLPFFAWRDRQGFVRYFMVLIAFSLALIFVREITIKYQYAWIGFWSGTLLGIAGKEWIFNLCYLLSGVTLLIWIFCFFSGRWKLKGDCKAKLGYREIMKASLSKRWRKVWFIVVVLVLGAVIWLFWDANHGEHPEWYQQYSNIFYFNNEWGTHRGHNWSILLRHFNELPPWKKLIGTGPETYGIVTRIYDYAEMSSMYGEIYDSPHNEVLQYLFTTGILGVCSYYGFIAANCWRALSRKTYSFIVKKEKNYKFAGVYAAGVYASMSLINISVPIVVPLMLLLLFMANSRDTN